VNPNAFLGYEGENEANKLVFEFSDGFRDGLGVLNVKRGDEIGYVSLVKTENTYEFPVKSAILTKVGEIKFQVVINGSDGSVIKYDPFAMIVKDAIDADTEMPEDYPDWVDMANAKLAEVDEAITKAETVSKQLIEDKENGVFDGKDGVSPTATVEQTSTGAKITTTDANGTHTAEVSNGKDGKDGVDGVSSEIIVKTSTDTEYVLTIKDVNGSFDTPNLKGKDAEEGIVNETDPIYLADKSKLALKTEIPTNLSELNNDTSFATESFVTNKIAEAELSGGDVDLSGYATKDELNAKANVSDIPKKVSQLTNDTGYITGYTETDPTVPSHVKSISAGDINNWNNKSNFSGSYNDLNDKPYIPNIIVLTQSEYDALVNAGTIDENAYYFIKEG
jgi:hypothetical protein